MTSHFPFHVIFTAIQFETPAAVDESLGMRESGQRMLRRYAARDGIMVDEASSLYKKIISGSGFCDAQDPRLPQFKWFKWFGGITPYAHPIQLTFGSVFVPSMLLHRW